MRKLTQAVLAIAATGIAATAFAAMPAFDTVDANKDGKISQEEARTVKDLDFAKADKDKNGTLDRAEYEAANG